jgi:two-component system, chemotaxis family, sensor kinase CheA
MDKKGDAFRKKLLATFKVEAGEHVQALSSGLIELEKTSAEEKRLEVIETVFREAHSLKGAARAVNQSEIEMLCQSIESVFSALKHKEMDLSAALLDLLHEAVDALDRLLRAAEKESAGPKKKSLSDLCRRLNRASKDVPASSERQGMTKEETETAPAAPEAYRTLSEEKPLLADTIRIPVARLDSVLLQVEGLLSAKLTASQRAAEIREAKAAFAALKKERAKIAREVKATQHSLERAKTPIGGRKNGAPVRKLLEFMAWEGDFVKSFESRLGALAKTAEHDSRSLGGTVDGLLDDVKKVLMMPVSSVLTIFPKFVRDLSRDRGKEVDLVVEGGGIEIDRRILEEMRDPLMHLIRNCIDHGIEKPEDRQHKGKPARATIAVSITQKDGGRIEILVSDDGAGIDVEKVRKAAEKLGVVSREDPPNLAEDDGVPLVFRSGVSTSPIITDISGRGLGLAIVREKVEKLSGAISVETQLGLGTSFRVVLPVTLATYRGIHVRVNEQQFVFPTAYVEQAAKVRRDDIKTVENRETIRCNGHAVSLVRLADVLELPRKSPGAISAETVPVVIAGSASSRIAFWVDEILNEQEVLVKSLGKQLPRVRNIAGATVLGNGKVVPILNIPDLMKSATKLSTVLGAMAPARQETVIERKAILVAEDSITSRMLLKGILESAGYNVATAVDGVDAFTLLRTEHFDLVVSDVDMPRMNGFDLSAKIRADKTLSELPLVLVTALDSREHRERGIDVGANAYIVKSSFDQSNLLEVIRRLL